MFNFIFGFIAAAVVFTFVPGVAVWFNDRLKAAWKYINSPRSPE